MLTNTITLNDGTDDTLYDLVSREGMESMRRETVVDSAIAASLVVKNTVNLSNPSAKNRHLIQLSKNQIDGTTGEISEGSVHVVISRHKTFTDAELILMLARLADLITTNADVTDVLRGGN